MFVIYRFRVFCLNCWAHEIFYLVLLYVYHFASLMEKHYLKWIAMDVSILCPYTILCIVCKMRQNQKLKWKSFPLRVNNAAVINKETTTTKWKELTSGSNGRVRKQYYAIALWQIICFALRSVRFSSLFPSHASSVLNFEVVGSINTGWEHNNCT